MLTTIITNAQIILPDDIVKGHLVIQDGLIKKVIRADASEAFELPAAVAGESRVIVDAQGMYVMPGMIELHCDSIEKEISPRPSSIFPLELAMASLEKKMAGYGITTLFHSICSSDGTTVRNDEMVARIIRYVGRKRHASSMIRHRIHYRYEITNVTGIQQVHDLISEQQIDFLSLMDHTPGQGQYGNWESYRKYLAACEQITEDEAEAFLNQLVEFKQNVDWDALQSLADYAISHGVQMASHDDDTTAKVDYMHRLGAVISEFPVKLEAAKYAVEQGMFVSIGAPNIVRGGSHNNNMKAMDAVEAGAAHILCSDYFPAALLPSVFKIAETTGNLAEAVKMVTYYPAQSLGIEDSYGSIAVGRTADLLLVEEAGGYPVVRKTWVGGTLVHEANYAWEAVTDDRFALSYENLG